MCVAATNTVDALILIHVIFLLESDLTRTNALCCLVWLQGDCEDDITFDAILPACARISHALGDKFEPYLAIVMEPLLRGAQQVSLKCLNCSFIYVSV